MFVLIRNSDGKYVAPAGSHHVYTDKLQNARVYMHKEDAINDKCGNETVIKLINVIHKPFSMYSTI